MTFLRVLGVYEEVDERVAVAKYQVTLVVPKWIGTHEAFEVGGAM